MTVSNRIFTRVATLDDLPEIIFLGRKTFIETYKGLGNRPEGLEEAYGFETFNEKKLTPQFSPGSGERGPIFILGFVDGTPAGFAKIEFDPPPPSVPNRKAAQFSQAYVLKEFRGQGLGHRFYADRRQRAKERGCTGLWLGVWDMNFPAIEFHKRVGFKVVGSAPWKFKFGAIDYEDNDLIMYQDI